MSNNPYLLTLPQLISAKTKIGRVAEVFDPLRHSLAGFGSQALTPTEFREQLRRNFGVNLSNAELGAIIRLFDKDGDEMVDTVEFLNEFFKLGKQERKKVTIRAKERSDVVADLKAKIAKKKEEDLARLAAIHVADTWSDEEEQSALKKLTKVAFSYNSVRGFLNPGVTVLGAFTNPQSLSPQEFKEQIRRNFDIKLSPQEAGALVHYFDDDGNGEIDAQEFLNNFFHLRRLEIDRHFTAQLNLTKKQQDQRARRKQIREDRFAEMCKPTVVQASDEDRKSAYDKIRMAAAFNKPNVFINAMEKSFESSDLTPAEFKEMMKNNFSIRLTAGELDAAIQIFDVDNDGTISCTEFMNLFYKMGLAEQSRLLKQKVEKDREIHNKARRRQERKEKKQLSLCATRIKWPKLPPVDGEDDDEESTFMGSSSSSSSASSDGTSIEGTITSTDMGDGLSLDGASAVSEPTFARAGIKGGSTQASKTSTRTSRKPAVSDILSADQTASKMANSDQSLVIMYPKASQATKDFIQMLEAQEKSIQNMKVSGRRSNSSCVSTARSSVSSKSTGTAGSRRRAKQERQQERNQPNSSSSARSAGSEMDELEAEDDYRDYLLSDYNASGTGTGGQNQLRTGGSDRPSTSHSPSKQNGIRDFDEVDDAL